MVDLIIRRAKLDELIELRDFYNENWGSKHPLINVREYVEFYFIDGEYLNFIIARKEETSEIIGACGYILSNSTDRPDAWGTLWLAKEGHAGLKVHHYLISKMKFRLYAANNIRKEVLNLHQFLRFNTAKMEHYYRLANRSSYQVAHVYDSEILDYETTPYILKRLLSRQELLDKFEYQGLGNNKPYKDLGYIIKRYYQFPFYSYLVYGILDEGQRCQTIVVMRVVSVNGTFVLRIVDLIGNYDHFSKIGHCIQELMDKFECEYTEFYCYGLDKEVLFKAGFSKRNEGDSNIIPEYLEPYSSQNTDLHFFCNGIDQFVLFKADGDQDKLNMGLI